MYCPLNTPLWMMTSFEHCRCKGIAVVVDVYLNAFGSSISSYWFSAAKWRLSKMKFIDCLDLFSFCTYFITECPKIFLFRIDFLTQQCIFSQREETNKELVSLCGWLYQYFFCLMCFVMQDTKYTCDALKAPLLPSKNWFSLKHSFICHVLKSPLL